MITGLKPYPAYNDSGVEWLGRVPSEWTLRRGKSLFRKMDRPVRDADEIVTCFRDGTVTLRRRRRMTGFTEAVQEFGYQGVRRGDLVIHQMDAFAGAIGVSDADGKASPVYSVCISRGDAIADYYQYVVRQMATSNWIAALGKGVRERSSDFRFETFGQQLMPFPPPAEQISASRFLANVDARIQRLIERKKQQLALLEEQKQATIHHAVTRGLDPNVSLKPSGVDWLGQIPDHWKVVALKRAVHRIIDCEHKTAPAVASSDFRVIRTSAVRGGRFVEAGTYCTDKKAFDEWTRRGAPVSGDVLLTREAPAGEACVVPDEGNYCLGQRMVLLKPDPTQCPAQFLVFSIHGGAIRQEIENASRGSTVAHFNVDDIGRLPLALPPVEEARKIVELTSAHLAEADQAISRMQRHVTLLREYGVRLIADVVTGKLDVREAAANLSDDPDADDPALDEQLEEVAAG